MNDSSHFLMCFKRETSKNEMGQTLTKKIAGRNHGTNTLVSERRKSVPTILRGSA